MDRIYNVVGGDTETCNGEPFSIQFVSNQIKVDPIIWVNAKTSTRKFLEWCDKLPEGETLIWFHNLGFDLISLFYDRHVLFSTEEFAFEYHGWEVSGIYAEVVFAKLIKGEKIVRLLDTGKYYRTKLDNLAQMFCPNLPKLTPPPELGNRIYTKDDEQFVEYAMRDSEITYIVGKYITQKFHDYEIPVSVSAPHMAANIFRHKYLKKDIPLPNKGKIFAALHSYHGGKNNITVPFGWYENVTLLDIISAYPKAMSELPDFSDLDHYHEIKGEGHPKEELPRYGIYRVSGTAKKCKWPIFYDKSFNPVEGDFDNLWVTGPELNEAIRAREVTITSLYGFFYDPLDKDYQEKSPFKKYVDEFFGLKNKADSEHNKLDREFYKLMLNALYGKFIQSKGEKDVLGYYYDLDNFKINREKLIIAGGLFHPVIASLITGIVRANIHFLEHKYSALHTATDGIFTTSKNYKTKSGLGGLKVEAEGDLLLFRNKLYILYGRKGKLQSKAFKNRYIIKYALHGFNGSVFDLEKIYVTGDPTYTFKKVNKLRESLRRNQQVNKFEERQGSLNLEKIVNGEETND